MKIIEPSATYLNKDRVSPTFFIEQIGRTCYKSLDKITEGSDKKFVKILIKSKHYAMVEHFWIHCVADCTYRDFMEDLNFFSTSVLANMGNANDLVKHIEITDCGNHQYISMPIRVAIEMLDMQNNSKYWDGCTFFQFLTACASQYGDFFIDAPVSDMDSVFDFYLEEDFIRLLWEDLAYFNDEIRKSEMMKHRTHCIKFITDRGVTHELVRHRPCSFAQESQRYCNYSKDKFGGDITFIKPFFFNRNPETPDSVKFDTSNYSIWLASCESSENAYMRLIENGATPQEARTVLPNSVKTEIIMTANEVEWQHILDLRYHGVTGAPHPQMKELMTLIYPQLVSNSEGRLK